MLRSIFTILLISLSLSLNAQGKAAIPDFGKTFDVKNPQLVLDKETHYKVIFDVFKDGSDISKRNRSVETVARFINMHTKKGVSLENLDIVLVMHGQAAKNSLNNEEFKNKFGKTNPNLKLLSALNKAGVKIYVCGQSLYSRGYNRDLVSKDVKVSLSALTALVHYQTQGYQQINFN